MNLAIFAITNFALGMIVARVGMAKGWTLRRTMIVSIVHSIVVTAGLRYFL